MSPTPSTSHTWPPRRPTRDRQAMQRKSGRSPVSGSRRFASGSVVTRTSPGATVTSPRGPVHPGMGHAAHVREHQPARDARLSGGLPGRAAGSRPHRRRRASRIPGVLRGTAARHAAPDHRRGGRDGGTGGPGRWRLWRSCIDYPDPISARQPTRHGCSTRTRGSPRGTKASLRRRTRRRCRRGRRRDPSRHGGRTRWRTARRPVRARGRTTSRGPG